MSWNKWHNRLSTSKWMPVFRNYQGSWHHRPVWPSCTNQDTIECIYIPQFYRISWLMSSSCHLDSASNVEICVECQIFVIVIFFNCSRVLQFGAHSRYYKGALTQKRSFLVLCTTFRSDFHVGWKNQNKQSTLNLSFDALSKWHDPHIRRFYLKLVKPQSIVTRFLG